VPPSVEDRLKAEAEFQNARIEAAESGDVEARARFYYLAARAMDRYHDMFEDVRGKRVVVVGCSEGGIQQHARNGAIVTGIDIADEAIANLNEEIEENGWQDNADARVMNAEDLDFEESSVDLICCSGVLHHLDVERAGASWSRVLKPEGRVVMIEPMAYNPAVALFRFATPSMRTDDEHPLTPKDFRILERHFSGINVEPHVLTTLLTVPVALMSEGLKDMILPSFEALDDFLTRRFSPLRYFCWTAAIELSLPRK